MKMRKRAFTVLEILLSVALTGLLLTAISMQIFSLSTIWMDRNEEDFFKQHVAGVTNFLQNAITRSMAMETNANQEDLDADLTNQSDPVVWQKPPGFTEFSEPLLTFKLAEAPPLLSISDAPLPAVSCYLYYDEYTGLGLMWYSLLSEVEDLDDVKYTHLTSYITDLEYCYYEDEEDEWEIFDEPEQNDDNQYMIPQFLKLRFEHDEDVVESVIFIPKGNQNVPLF